MIDILHMRVKFYTKLYLSWLFFRIVYLQQDLYAEFLVF